MWRGVLLVFPSFYRRERPDLVGHPAVFVSYRFSGFLDDIYATLVVRLHHSEPFQSDELWRYAADFKTLSGQRLGRTLRRHEHPPLPRPLFRERSGMTDLCDIATQFDARLLNLVRQHTKKFAFLERLRQAGLNW